MHFQKLLPEQMQYEDSKDQSVENFMEKCIMTEWKTKLNANTSLSYETQKTWNLWYVILWPVQNEFQKYYYKIKWTKANHFNERSILDQYFTKLPNPWGMETLRGYLENLGQKSRYFRAKNHVCKETHKRVVPHNYERRQNKESNPERTLLPNQC